MSDLLEHVERTMSGLFESKDTLVVAVSGGVDSMVLLHICHQLAIENKWRLHVAHLNHRLRGRASAADEVLVRRAAKTLRLPLTVECADVCAYARAHAVSIEMAARRLRHEFLARVALAEGASAILLAHHADDQLELFFLRLLRGTSTSGLAGMSCVAPSPAGGKALLIRPLLGFSKSALRQYAQEHKINFREDRSNVSVEFQRNRVRHELLPLIRRHYQPAVDTLVPRLMQILRAEADYFTSRAVEWLRGTIREKFDALPLALQRHCLHLQLVELGIPADYELIEQLRASPGIPICVPAPPVGTAPAAGILTDPVAVLRTVDGQLQLVRTRADEFNTAQLNCTLKGRAGRIDFAGLKLHWSLINRTGAFLPLPRSGTEYFDAEKIGSRFLLRHWQPGDRFQPIGADRAVKLQDIFTNQKIPRSRRHELILAATEGGEVFWVEGLRISERFKLTKATSRRLKWSWKRLDRRVAAYGVRC